MIFRRSSLRPDHRLAFHIPFLERLEDRTLLSLFGSPVNYNVGTNPQALAVEDFNKDGKLDIAVANSGSNAVSILLGKGDGAFVNGPTPAVGPGPDAIAAG